MCHVICMKQSLLPVATWFNLAHPQQTIYIKTLLDTEYPMLMHSYDCNYGFPSVMDSFPLMPLHAS